MIKRKQMKNGNRHLTDGQRGFLSYMLECHSRVLTTLEDNQITNCLEEGAYRINGSRTKSFNALRKIYLRDYENYIIDNQ